MRARAFATLFALVALGACGGQVDRPSGSGGSSAGGAGTGGIGGASTGGLGGTSFGGAAAMGGAGTGGTPNCPPIASCNWCNGATTYDASGCILGWTCANGVDPCKQPPCENDCPIGEACGPDMLCWPETQPPTCTPKECDDKPYDCSCKWSCSNGSEYSFECSIGSGTTQCQCMQNDVLVDGCEYTSSDGGSSNACPIGDSCCNRLPH